MTTPRTPINSVLQVKSALLSNSALPCNSALRPSAVSALFVQCALGSGLLLGCDAFSAVPLRSDRSHTIRVVPEDTRPAVRSEVAPPPVTGGNLIRLRSAGNYMASDPLRDELQFVAESDTRRLSLPLGSQPERAALNTKDGSVHVVLRGTSSILAVDPTSQRVLAEHKALCAAPRGIAYDRNGDRLLVACAEGKLLFHSADATNYNTLNQVNIDVDARDVVVQNDSLFVSRFRSAEVIQLTNQGELVRKVSLPRVTVNGTRVLDAAVAWRLRADPYGDGVLMLHQRALATELAIDPQANADELQPESPYGGSLNPCTNIVQTAVTRVNSQGDIATSPSLDGAVLAVDFDVAGWPDRSGYAYSLAVAGATDPDAPKVETREISPDNGSFDRSPSSTPKFGVAQGGPMGTSLLSLVSILPRSLPLDEGPAPDEVGCDSAAFFATTLANSVTLDGEVAVFVRPAEGTLLRSSAGSQFPVINMAEPVAMDTGHEIFHRDTGNGIACASCHPEGTDDGRVWQFQGLGARRTQHLGLSIAETAPYHWDGSLPTLGSLMSEVFVERMGGIFESPERLDALQAWMSREQHQQQVGELPESAQRGQVLFESKAVGCSRCHSGTIGTDNLAYDVGTTPDKSVLQTPALAGLALHPPFLHNGCAKTLRERFNPDCGGGDRHGTTSQLSADELDDLVSYLQTL